MSLTHAEKHLALLDPKLGVPIVQQGTIPLVSGRSYFEALCRSIISQQISVKAAASIFERFRHATDIKPERVLKLTEVDTKSIGLSGQKVRYLTDLALHFTKDSAVFDHLGSLSDDEVIAELTKVKGIGVWTAHMFLIFTLHRPDVFAPDDRGLQIAIEKIYDKSFSRSELVSFAERWEPHRSTACLHLWRSLDNKPI